MPADMTEFEISSDYPVVIRTTNFTKVYNMADLDADTKNIAVYHDTTNGLVSLRDGRRVGYIHREGDLGERKYSDEKVTKPSN